MSDQSQGPGWWQASDGQWYPPEQHPEFGQGGPPTEAMPGTPPPAAPSSPPSAPPVTAPVGAAAGPAFTPPPSVPPSGPPTAGLPPAGGPPPGATPPKSGLGRGPLIGIIVGLVVLVALAAFLLTRDSGGKKENAATSSEQSTDSSSSKSKSSSSSSSKSSKSSSSSSSSATTTGFTTIKDSSSGVSIGIPSGFKQIDPSQLGGGISSDQASQLNPDLAPFAAQGSAFLGNSLLAAQGNDNGQPTVIIVANSPTEAIDPTSSAFVDVLKTELTSVLPGATVDTTTVTLPAGPAVKITLSLPVENGSKTVSETLYFVKTSKGTFGIVGASVGGTSNADLMDKVVQTFAVS